MYHQYNFYKNILSIEEYKSIRAPIFGQSYFENIKQVSPGQCLINGYYFDSYYELNGNYENISNEIIESTLIKAIKSRKVSDVPIVFFYTFFIYTKIKYLFQCIWLRRK